MQNCIDKCLPAQQSMDDDGGLVDVVVVAFGPLAERMGGRTHRQRVKAGQPFVNSSLNWTLPNGSILAFPWPWTATDVPSMRCLRTAWKLPCSLP